MKQPLSTQTGNELDRILSEREQTLAQIRQKRAEIRETFNLLTTPPPAASRYDAIVNNVGRVVAMADGLMMGIKLTRRLRKAFKR